MGFLKFIFNFIIVSLICLGIGALLTIFPILAFILIPLGAFWFVYQVHKQEKEAQIEEEQPKTIHFKINIKRD